MRINLITTIVMNLILISTLRSKLLSGFSRYIGLAMYLEKMYIQVSISTFYPYCFVNCILR